MPIDQPKIVSDAQFDVFERTTDLLAHHLAFFRDEHTDNVTENDRLMAGHLAGALWANKLLVEELPSKS